MVKIETYSEEYLQRVIELNAEVMAKTVDGLDADYFRERHEDLNDIANNYDEFLLAIEDLELVGMGGYRFEEDSQVAEIKRVRVDTERQSEGIGTEIVEELERRADEENAECIKMYTARLLGSVEFWQSQDYHRFETEKIQRQPVGEIEVLHLKKELY